MFVIKMNLHPMLLYHVTTLLGIFFEILISKMNRAKHPLYCGKINRFSPKLFLNLFKKNLDLIKDSGII